MTAYRVGEVVDITIRGARVMAPKPGIDDVLTIGIAEGRPGIWHTVEIPKDAADGVTVTRVAPPEWPPRAGDLWRDADRRLWFVTYGATGLAAQTTARDCMVSRELLDRCGPLTLVHREPDGGGQP